MSLSCSSHPRPRTSSHFLGWPSGHWRRAAVRGRYSYSGMPKTGGKRWSYGVGRVGTGTSADGPFGSSATRLRFSPRIPSVLSMFPRGGWFNPQPRFWAVDDGRATIAVLAVPYSDDNRLWATCGPVAERINHLRTWAMT